MMLLQGRSARIFTLSLHDRRMLAGRSRGGGGERVYVRLCRFGSRNVAGRMLAVRNKLVAYRTSDV